MNDEQIAMQIVRDAQYDEERYDEVSIDKLIAAIAQALRDARKAPAGHIIDDDGVVRRLDGKLCILADGVIAEYGNSYWYWDIISEYHQPIKYGWTERVLESCEPHGAEYSWTTDPKLCYSTKESALKVRKEQP